MKNNTLLKIWRIIYPLGTHFIISQFVVFVSAILVSAYAMLKIASGSEDFVGINPQIWTLEVIGENAMLLTLFVSLLSLPILYFYLWRDYKRNLLQKDQKVTVSIGFVLIGAITSSIGLNLLIGFTPLIEWSPTYQELSKAIYMGNVGLELITAAFFVPMVEEILFRGLIYGRLRKEVGIGIAAIFSSVLFGLYHQNLVQFVYATFLGLLFVFFMEKTHSLKGAILAHMMANFVSVISTETKIFDWIYYNEGNYLATTVICFVITGIVVKMLWSKKIKK